MNTNDILRSLTQLEQSIKDIDSARTQVYEVVTVSENLAKIIETYKTALGGISSDIKQILDESKEVNLGVISELSAQKDNLKDEISKLTEFDFDTKFQTLQKEVVGQFEKDLLSRLVRIDKKAQDVQEDLSKQINSLKVEISKLTEFDFDTKFQTLQKEVVGQFEKDLLSRLVQIDKKTQDIKVKIDEFKAQITRLEAVDLEKHFKSHQEMLSNIFGSINSVHLNLSNVSQHFNSIKQNFEFFEAKQKEIVSRVGKIEKSQAEILSQMADRQKEIIEEIYTLHDENIQTLTGLQKGVKTNRVFQICGLVLLITILGFILFKF